MALRDFNWRPGVARRLRAALLASSALCATALLPAAAQDATWLNAPGSGDFNTGANWDTATVPTGTAFFDTSGTTALSFSASASLDGWTFNPGASAYNFTNGQTLQFMGAGIVINGGSATIANSGNVSFRNTSTAGNAAFTTSGLLRFFETSTAGSATITNNFGGQLYFTNASTAGSATIASNFDLTFQNTSTAGSAAITNNFNMYFTNTSTAGSASITNNRDMAFNDTSTAGSAAITNNSTLVFANTSTAGSAAITNGASGTTDFSYSTGPLGDNKLSAGSIAGGGTFSLGQNELTVGGNDLSTTVTGVIADGGFGGGAGASLVKTGAGTLTLSGDNTYTGGTTISAGALRIGDGGTTGSVLGNITNNAALIFDRSDAITFGNVIGGSGTLEKLGTGTLTLSGVNTYTGATTVNDGTLAISGSVASGTIANNAALQYIGTATAGSAAIANNATLMFRDTATAGSASIANNFGGVLGSSLYFLDTSTAGSAAISSDNSLVSFSAAATAGNATITNNGGSVLFTGTSTAGSAAITNNGGGQLNFSTTTTAGNATITNNVGFLFFRVTSTAGNATITNNATMRVEQNSTADNAAITNNSLIEFRHTSTAGNAAITNGVSGNTDFSQSTGPLGDHKLSAGSLGGGGTFRLGQNELTVGGNDFSTNVTGIIADGGGGGGTGGSLIKTGTGTMTLSGINTYTGATTVNAGTLDISGSIASSTIANNATLSYIGTATAGSATITTNGVGTLNFNDTSTAGSATFAINDFSTLAFKNSATAGSATIVNNYVLEFSGTSTAGNAAIVSNDSFYFRNASTAGNATITNNSFLTFYDNSTAGSATITNNGSVLTFNGASTAGNATITNDTSSDLTFYNTTTAGSAAITNNGRVFFVDTSTAGNAAITNGASGGTDFSYSTGPLGDNKLSAGSLGGGGYFSLGQNELTVGGNNLSTNVTGVIEDSGYNGGTGASLVKTGTGTMTLSGINTYTGATTVNGGTLAVNGSILASSGVTVNSGGALGGTGNVGATTIASGGALAPGNSIGTLTVQGNLTFNAGSFYTVEVSPSAADRTNVTGTATLTGATVQAVALAGSFRAQTYTILNATAGFGGTQFAGINVTGSSISPGARNPHLTYDLNNVFLVLDPGTIQIPAGIGGNQAGVAGAINNAVENGATPPAGFDVLLNLSGPALSNALNQVSGQAPSGATQSATQMMSGFLSLTLNPYGGAPQGNAGAIGYARAVGASELLPKEAADAYAAIMPVKAAAPSTFGSRWSVWGQGFGGYNRTGGDVTAGTSDTTARAYGFAAGADYRVTSRTTLGFALAGGETRWSLAQGLGGGKSDVFQAGLYGSHSFGAAYVSGALAYAWHDTTTDRTVTVSGTDMLRAQFDAHSFGGRLEAGYRIATRHVGITPYIAGQVQTFRTPSYSEAAVSGANTFALSYNSRSVTATRFELGSWFDKLLALNNGNAILLRGRAAWAHDEGGNGGISAAFQTLPGSSFTVNGAAPPRDLALVSAGGELRLRNGISLGAKFDGEFASRSQTYAGTGTVRYAW